MDFKVDTIIGVESRGFVFGSPIARDLEVPFVMARKWANYQRNIQ